MGQELARWQQPRTTLSLEQRSSNAKLVIAHQTAPSEALKAAKQLVGSYAHLRPDQPETFLASIASVLAQYPLGIVQECVDPRLGIARKAEFLSVAKLVEWLDNRLAYHQALASYVKRRDERVDNYAADLTDEDRKAASEFMANLAKEIAERSRARLASYAPKLAESERAGAI